MSVKQIPRKVSTETSPYPPSGSDVILTQNNANQLDGYDSDEEMGFSVAMSGDAKKMIVGRPRAYNDDQGGISGGISIYNKNDSGIWTLEGSLYPGDDSIGTRYGDRVAIAKNGQCAAVLSSGDGIVRIYRNDAETSVNIPGTKSIALNADGSRIVIGVPTGGPSNAHGLVVVYTIIDNTHSVYTAITNYPIGTPITGLSSHDNAGDSVCINDLGDIIAFTVPGRDDAGNNAGEVRVYKLTGLNWVQLGQDINNAASHFGMKSIAMDSTGLIVAIGHTLNTNGTLEGVSVYKFNGSLWETLGTRASAIDIASGTGTAVALSADGYTLVTSNADFASGDRHVVQVFRFNGFDWKLVGQDVEAIGTKNGHSLDISADGKTIIAGAPAMNLNGRVYHYTLNV